MSFEEAQRCIGIKVAESHCIAFIEIIEIRSYRRRLIVHKEHPVV